MSERQREYSFKDKGESRKFSENRLVRAGLVASAVAAGLYAAWGISGKPTPEDFKDSFKVENPLNPCLGLVCEPIEGEVKKQFLTDPIPGRKTIIIRDLPLQGEDSKIGWANGGLEVRARAHYGVVYPSSGIDSHGLGKIEGPDGRVYGKWFLVDEIWGFNNEGKPTIFKDVFVAGNFLI